MAVTIAVLSQKGGTGKTTLVRSLADVFERLGVDTLAVDADPQGNLSDYFDTDPDAEPTLSDVLQGKVRAAEAIHDQVIPANLTLAEAELAVAGKIGREVTLRSALMDLKRNRELILIDCPPTLGLLTVNALVAADYAILSTEAQYFSLQGVEQAMEVVALARDSLNPQLELLGVVLNIANMRTKHARQTLEALRERFGDKVFRTVIRQSIAYAESAERAVPILDYRPDRGVDYLSLTGEILRRLSRHDLLESLDKLSTEVVPAGARRKRAEPPPAPAPASAEVDSEPERDAATGAVMEEPPAAEQPQPEPPRERDAEGNGEPGRIAVPFEEIHQQ
jgi:chromosome partitioning protein